MATFVSAEMASHERIQHQQHESTEPQPGKRMHAVWRAVWWLLLVNILLFSGLSGIIAVL
jgi:hypothetical protein